MKNKVNTLKRSWTAALSVNPANLTSEKMYAMAENGICHIEISCGDLEPWFENFDYIHRSVEFSSLARANGVEISSIHLPFAPFGKIDPAHASRDVRAEIIETQSSLIKAASEAGITIAVIHPSGEPYKEEEREERIECALETISALCCAAESSGITLALENLPRTCLCRTSDEMKRFLEKIPDLRVCFDTNHSLTEKNPDYIRAVGDKIVTLHVSDYDFIDERHVLPGKGLIDWKELVETLDDVGYSGRFLYETNDFASYEELYGNYEYLMNL